MTTKPIRNPETITQSLTVEQLVVGHATSDGAGVKLTRVLTQSLQRRLDPFLMLDAFGSDAPDDYIAGFPDHPQRGIGDAEVRLHPYGLSSEPPCLLYHRCPFCNQCCFLRCRSCHIFLLR